MYTRVAVNVYVKRRQAHGEQDPDESEMSFVTCPMERGVLSIFLGVGWPLKWIVILITLIEIYLNNRLLSVGLVNVRLG
jgi:hypothetical protein